MRKKLRPVQKNDHINSENGTFTCRKMTNMRYAKFFKLRKIKKINVFCCFKSFNYQNDISMKKVP